MDPGLHKNMGHTKKTLVAQEGTYQICVCGSGNQIPFCFIPVIFVIYF